MKHLPNVYEDTWGHMWRADSTKFIVRKLSTERGLYPSDTWAREVGPRW